METAIINFYDKPMEILTIDGRKCMTAETIGKALGYENPRIKVNNLYQRFSDEFEEGVDVSVPKLGTEAGERPTRVFFHTGAILLIGFSRKPLAKEFRKWAKHVLAQATIEQRSLQEKPVTLNRIEYVGLLRDKIKLLEELRFKDRKLYVANLAKKYSYSRTLSERYQLVAQLYSCGISITEIAVELSLPAETVYRNLKKANMVRGGE